MEWIFNPDLTEEKLKQIYEDEDRNPDNWSYCKRTWIAFKTRDAEELIKHYGEDGYVGWLKEQKIIIPKDVECATDNDLPSLSATSSTEAAKSYSHIEKLNNDPGYLRLKIKELEGDIAKIEYRNEQHRDKITKLVDEKEELENRLDECKKECSKWYTNYKELDTKIGALQDVLNGIRIIIGG